MYSLPYIMLGVPHIHIDVCQKGPDQFLVVIDSHSKWLAVRHMSSTNTERTVGELRLIFAPTLLARGSGIG